MSSWIPSLFNPFSDVDDDPTSPSKPTPRTPTSGAKDDISAVFRGVAAFLAPPQETPSAGPSSETIAGIKNDLAEIQGSFRSGLSLISSKLTSNFLQVQNQLNDVDENDEEEEDDGVGINEQVLDFVGKISRRPELWTDFPLSLPDDYFLSEYQREHAANIDHLVPEFVTMRQKICDQMSDGKFWLIYFILLLPRLNEEDMDLLSTPQVADARETLMNKLQSKTKIDKNASDNPDPSDTNKGTHTEGGESACQHEDATETVNPSEKRDNVVNDTPSDRRSDEVGSCTSTDSRKQPENEEDVSFSDLEDDDNDLSDKLSRYEDSKRDKAWFQLNENSGVEGAKQNADQYGLREKESEGEESNDWLTVDDTDFDNLAAI